MNGADVSDRSLDAVSPFVKRNPFKSSSLSFSSLSVRLSGSFTRICCQSQSFSILQGQRITIKAAPADQKAGLPFDRRVIDHTH
jgi:hypothetical protein